MQLLTFNVNRKRSIRLHINSVVKIVLISINKIVFSKHNRFSNYKRLKSFNHTQKICHKINIKINRVKLNLLLLQLRNDQKTCTICNLNRRLHHITIIKISNRVNSTSITIKISNNVNRITTFTIKSKNSFSQFDSTFLFSNELIMKTN